jgi:peptidoglycan-N-acetylglucosamine deacetylase
MRIKYFVWGMFLVASATIAYQFIPVQACTPQQREIALTFDDLPITPDASTKIVQTLVTHQAPAIGFVIAERVNPESLPSLHEFLVAGFPLGSHSYSHPNLRKTSAELYIADLERADKILTPLMTGKKYFRYPYLAEGMWPSKQKVLAYLQANHYTVAPVTIDSRDFEFNQELLQHSEYDKPEVLSQFKQRYVNFVWEQTKKAEQKQQCRVGKQIILLHANVLNSLFLGDLLQMYAGHGYRFISLDDALQPQ